jgi:hypothetical protein
MSKIEVNAIEPQSGTTLTIGASGDTVALAAGATSTGFGATYNGAVNWSSTIYSTDFTAVSGVGYFVDTSAGVVNVTLPASPSFGAIVAIKDWASTAATNNINILRNGSLIEGNTSNARLANHGLSTTLVYSGAGRGWQAVDTGDVNDLQIPSFVAATGGTVLTCGNYKTHVFTGPGSFVVTSGGNDVGSNSVEYMVVAGGGGDAGYGAGGGGAGGFRTNYPSPEISGLVVSATTYPITVGGGGGNPYPAPSGSPSIFSTITSAGGGPGGVGFGAGPGPGIPGGSGGGGGSASGGPFPAGTGNTPPVSPPQGNPGGTGGPPSGTYSSGGGGGASQAGVNFTSPGPGGPGGDGSYLPNGVFGPTAPSYGTPGPVPGVRYFAGGGGGASSTNLGGSPGNGGAGGGGKAGSDGGTPTNSGGTANTGGGSGGFVGGGLPAPGGGAGGSGIVVIRYKYQ